MNADRLLDAFDRLGDEPETVQQFRKVVVGLAMSGKLGAPDEAALPPSGLLKEIEARKRALLQQGTLRKQGPLSPVSFEDLPKGFTNPLNFIRLGEVARIEKGQTGIMKAEPGAYPLVVTAEDRGTCDHFDFDGAAAIVPLVSSAGHGKASLQRLHYQEGKFALGSILAAIFPHAPELISARFLFEYLTAFKDELLVSQMIGTANVSLSVGKVADVPVPLVPPLVQRKVDELMALCDRLEAARQTREATRDKLTSASLDPLNAPDPETFRDDAHFALDALPALTTRADQIKHLRQTILNLAVRGKLVPQDANDEPASELLKRIAAEKARLVKAGRVRDNQRADHDRLHAARMDLPPAWEQVTVAKVAYLRSGVAVGPDEEKPAGDIPYVKVADLSLSENERGIRTSSRFVGARRISDAIEIGSIVFPKRGGAIATNRKRLSLVKIVGDTNLMAMKPYLDETRPFIEMWFNSFDLWTLNSGTSVPQINNKDIYPLALPLPPLPEQRSIVAKVDELMALCDRLEASLTTADETCRRLLEALLAEALAPADARELEAAE